MKTYLLALGLMTSTVSFAQSVYVNPTVFNFGNSIQVQVRNPLSTPIHCSGTIHMNTMLGRSETAFYNDRISGHSMSMRSFYLMNFNDRVSYSHPFINCYQAK